MPSKVRRPQASKGFVVSKKKDAESVRRMQDLRRSNASGIHKGQGEYERRPKHMGRGWGDE